MTIKFKFAVWSIEFARSITMGFEGHPPKVIQCMVSGLSYHMKAQKQTPVVQSWPSFI